jgi:hypothetical protein
MQIGFVFFTIRSLWRIDMAEVVREEDGAEPAAAPLVFAYYVTGHGLGHATRVVEVRIWS